MEEKQTPTLKEAVDQYLAYLTEIGKRPGTVATYGKDFELAIKHFGENRKIDSFITPNISEFFKADLVNKLPNGKDRAKPTIDKTKRAVRMMFTWAKDKGLINRLPIPKDEIPQHAKKTAVVEEPTAVEETANEAA